MNLFSAQAEELASKLEMESTAGVRDEALNTDLAALRESWKALEPPERDAVAGHSARIAALVKARPVAPPFQPSPLLTPRDEAAEATLALQGLEGIEQDQTAPVRTFDGPRDPASLLAHMGYDSFRPGQEDAVRAALEGRDSLIVMPTGGGKSLCYQLPGLASTDLTLVVSPLIALMADQVRRLKKEGHPAVMFASGLSDEVSAASYNGVRDGSARIAYCSPERFASASFLDLIATRKVDLLAIDEAHCLSEWGHDFRPDYLRLPRVAERLGRPPVMACTATATQQVADEIAQRMGMDAPEQIHSGFDRPNLSFDTVALEGKGSKARKQALLEHGLADPANRPAIVYCGTRRDTEELGDDLRASGLTAVSYHAGMPADDRASAQHRFMEGDADVVVATNAFGMGIDKANVRSVWHWAIPSSVEAYYQEAGRAGRDGAPARAVLLAMRSDLGRLVRFNEQRKVDPNDVTDYIASIRHMADADGSVVMEAPRRDEERIRLAVAERAGALAVDPATGGRLLVRLIESFDPSGIPAACRVAQDRGWKAYRAVEAFSFSDHCRRRQLLDHFGDDSPTAPSGRCCDVCDPAGWLPDPASLVVKKSRSNPKRGAAPVPDLAPEDQEIFEILRKWRLGAAGDRPAFHVASNRTLSAIATVKPTDEDALLEISGVGPSFMEKHGSEVLRLVSDHS
ncbi:MAG TPA: ATP-dependent DNA helicase RecQ [Solirubrobacterales bacterium]|nr:ATP-dependent DNA helicase RecQ [Solirubrobacterales bacterium]